MAISGFQFLPVGKKLVETLNNTVAAQLNNISEKQIQNIMLSEVSSIKQLLRSLGVTVHDDNGSL